MATTVKEAKETNGLCSLQVDRLESLKQIIKNFKKDSSTRKTKSYFDVRLEKIELLQNEFSKTHKTLICSTTDREISYFKTNVAAEFEETYFDVRSALLDKAEEFFPSSSQQQTQAANMHPPSNCSSSIKLPQLPVPSFSGRFIEWPAFHDAFTRLIHNNNELNSIQKFHFLKEALPIDHDVDIQKMALTEINYTTAWDLIVKRYDNPRLLFMHHINALFKMPAITKERSEDIKALLNAANVCINEFLRLKIAIANCDHWIAYLLTTKLPKETHESWEHHQGSNTNIPTFSALEAFLNNRLVTIDVIENRNQGNHAPTVDKNKHGNAYTSHKKGARDGSGYQNKSFHTTSKSGAANSCSLCSAAHILRRCSLFLAKDCFERKAFVDRAKLCINCLSKTHTTTKCPSSKNCFLCGQRHHTLLHFPTPRVAQPNIESSTYQFNNLKDSSHSTLNQSAPPFRLETTSNDPKSLATHTTLCTSSLVSERSLPNKVLLATALVTLSNEANGLKATLRALIDQGSEITIISEHAAQSLGLKRVRTIAEISGVGNGASNHCKFTVNFNMRSCVNPQFNINVLAYVLNSLTTKLPSQDIEPQSWTHLDGLKLADPSYYQSRRIDLIIGADQFAQIMLPGTRIGNSMQPMAQNTELGWILTGNTTSTHIPSISVRCHHTTIELENLVQRFYELEQVPAERTISDEDSWCEAFFKKTHCRQTNGKYMVRLPLKSIYDPNQTLGKSKQIALNRFHYLERKLQRNTDLLKRYEEGIHEYFELKQIIPAPSTEHDHCVLTQFNKPTVTSCVLPHHAVLKEDSETTKFRIVFDASCKTSNGKSLNDLLCTGPVLQNELPAVIMNWRKHKFAFTADIQKMYRCIEMHPEDCHYQRILWRNQGKIQEYCLTTVTFGTASAPFTAIRVLHQLAEDERQSYPLAEPVLKQEIYVDDVLSGSHSLDTAVSIRNQVSNALSSAGMQLRKWSSNSESLLSDLPRQHLSANSLLELNHSGTVKTLGIFWQPNQDIFTFKLNFSIKGVYTKRAILSTVARLFDPFGFIAPVIVSAKIILKAVWSYKITRADQTCASLDWDEALPTELQRQWTSFLDTLPAIEAIAVPRWLNYEPTLIASIQLHAFCDGSSNAYAASIYLRVECNDGHIYTKLLLAKTRVTPIKPLTIPRVELCGAVLAAELTAWTYKSFNVPNLKLFYWTDATIILYWLRGDTSRWKTWVANRVDNILKTSSFSQWSHVDTAQNPADCATRGLQPQTLSEFSLWWSGPKWLAESMAAWPRFEPNKMQVDEDIAEIKPSSLMVHFTICQDSVIFRYSSLNKTLRVCAYIQRFAFNCRTSKQSRRIGPLSVEEIKKSTTRIISLVQKEAFAKEIQAVTAKDSLPNNSKLKSLTPFLDQQNILRVLGRLEHANLSFDQKHPIILPKYHHFSTLVISNAHHRTLHGGTQLTLSYIRQKYWILNARRVVSQQIRKCIKCFRNKPEVATQLMGDLPVHRVNPPQRPFLATGVDFTGAIELKASRYRGNTMYKGYIAIFICLATKAVHLEAVTGLSTEQFLMALQRFIGRRGICKDIYSDCGTNFIGADKVLQDSRRNFVEAINRDIVPKLTSLNIQWHFNPPHSPNFGGLWEANVKSTKFHLKRVISGNRLTYEELSTFLVRIESCLNSRPLCPLTSDPDDLIVLTPGHFLIGDSLLAIPECVDSNISLSEQFLQTQRMLQQFWKYWSSDWLSHLQTRPKWCQRQPNLQINDLVLVKDDRLPPNTWNLGRIIDIHPGADKLVRVVTLRMQNGIYKRSVSKLCPLPIPNYTDETQIKS